MGLELGIKNLYNNNRIKIFSMVLKNNGTYDDDCDILQEGVITVWNNYRAKKINDLNCTLDTYLYSVCRNKWLNELRRRGKSSLKLINEAIAEQIPNESEVDMLIENEAKIKVIENGLTSLGDTCQKVLRLFYYENRSMEEIASQTGLSSENAAKTKKYKCLQQLKKKVA